MIQVKKINDLKLKHRELAEKLGCTISRADLLTKGRQKLTIDEYSKLFNYDAKEYLQLCEDYEIHNERSSNRKLISRDLFNKKIVYWYPKLSIMIEFYDYKENKRWNGIESKKQATLTYAGE